MHEAVVAHLHKSCGQDVLEEAADEFHGGQRHGAKTTASVFSVLEGNQTVLNTLDPAVGNGDLEHVGGEVTDSVAVFPDRLTVDVPGCFPCLGRDGFIQVSFLHFILEPGFE